MAFHDGLGERRTAQDPAGADVDLLRLRQELSTVPSFEFALRERISRLANFRHPAFARIRSLERPSASDNALTVVSDHAPGVRLSVLLTAAEERGVPVDLGAALCLLRQLVPAIAILHETARDAAHGAIAPERLIVTPSARLIVAEYALGSALEQLLFARDRYWTELRVPLPRAAGLARFDHAADVLQIGVVALSLILGRRLKDDEHGGRLADLVTSARATLADGGSDVLPDALQQWLQRALHLDARGAFPSAIEARLAFDRVIEECGDDASPTRLEALLARCRGEWTPRAVAADPPKALARPTIVDFKPLAEAPRPVTPAPSPIPSATAVAAVPPVAPRAATPTGSSSPESFIATTVVRSGPDRAPAMSSSFLGVPTKDDATGVDDEVIATPARRSKTPMVAAVLVAVAVIGIAATVARPRLFPSAPARVTTGTLIITTDPSGAQASVDGVAHGVTPLTLALPPGAHTLIVRGEHGERTVPVTIAAGSQVAQYLDMPKPAPAPPAVEPAPLSEPVATVPVTAVADAALLAGWVAVTSRFDVQLFEDGKLLGTSESDRIMVGAGKHEIELVNDELGYRGTRAVQVAPGKVSMLSIDPPKGTIALNAIPWAEVTIDGERAGETPLGNVSLPIGAHDVVFRHPELGEQRYRVSLTLKAPSRLSADLRKK